jgi:hypothetical protein
MERHLNICMKLTQHPEHLDYQRDLRTFQQIRQATKEWDRDRQVIIVKPPGLWWTYPRAREFIQSLSSLFQDYNHILWYQFPYCDQCHGQCCGVKAAGVHLVDLFALAMFGLSLPRLAGQVQAARRDCIYYTDRRCSWPAEWKTVKCWLFYCLGSGDWKLSEPVSRHYNKISQELEKLIQVRLPEALRNYEIHSGDRFAGHLIDPLDFANTFCHAMQQILVGPFVSAFFPDDQMPALRDRNEITSDTLISSGGLHAFIAEVAEEIEQCSANPSSMSKWEISQMLEDLEDLEMIALGHPGNEKHLLTEMYARYSRAARPEKGRRVSIAYRMRIQIQQLLNSKQIRNYREQYW